MTLAIARIDPDVLRRVEAILRNTSNKSAIARLRRHEGFAEIVAWCRTVAMEAAQREIECWPPFDAGRNAQRRVRDAIDQVLTAAGKAEGPVTQPQRPLRPRDAAAGKGPVAQRRPRLVWRRERRQSLSEWTECASATRRLRRGQPLGFDLMIGKERVGYVRPRWSFAEARMTWFWRAGGSLGIPTSPSTECADIEGAKADCCAYVREFMRKDAG